MALQKPGWLAGFLGLLNWQILNIHINVGDTVETAIDFVISWINYIWELAQGAWNYIITVVDWVVDLWDMIWAELGTQVSAIWANISTWWDSVMVWWEAVYQGILDYIGSIVQWAQDALEALRLPLNNLIVAWNNFVTVTLPELISSYDVTLIIATFLQPFRALFNFWEEFRGEIAEFIDDPYLYLWNRAEAFIERFW